MTNTIRSKSLALILAAAASAQSLDMSLLQKKAGTGKQFGARDIYACDAAKTQFKGPPTAQQAQALVICAWERTTGAGTLAELYLTEDMKVQIGRGRPFERGDGSGDVDVSQPVYPIRGSFNYSRCYPVNTAHPAGKSCKKTEQPNAAGLCYKTTFGDWKCNMGDVTTRKVLPGYFPAPN